MNITDIKIRPSGVFDFFVAGRETETGKTCYLHRDGKWRKLAVTIDPKDSTKRLRTGYFESEQAAKNAVSKWESALSPELSQ